MASRRMFSRDIMQSDAFVELSIGVRLCYVYLNLNADDDGFVENPKGVARLSGCDYTGIEELKASKFVIECRTGLFVVVHWMLHNYIQNDRKHETRFTEEKGHLYVVNKEYICDDSRVCIHHGYKEDTGCIQNVSKMEPENSIGEEGEEERSSAPPIVEEVENIAGKTAFLLTRGILSNTSRQAIGRTRKGAKPIIGGRKSLNGRNTRTAGGAGEFVELSAIAERLKERGLI